jgi:UDP-3-O-[3-hydroxymyristoyl] N-acetylglucosamine deacetylase
MHGVGVHTGTKTHIEFLPALPGQGISFLCPHALHATVNHVVSTKLSTTLASSDGTSRVGMVEHALAACVGLGITDIIIKIDSHEMPIMDGSAADYAHTLLHAGLQKSSLPHQWFIICSDFEYKEGQSTIRFEPGNPTFDVTVHLGHDTVHHAVHCPLVDSFAETIAPARTFMHLKDVDVLKNAGYIKGGSLDCAVVLDDGVPINSGGWRMENECAHHKIIDMMGDFALAGHPLYGTIKAINPGHTVNVNALQALLKHQSATSLGVPSQATQHAYA